MFFFYILAFASFIEEMTVQSIFRKGAAKWESWTGVVGAESATFQSNHQDLIHLTRASKNSAQVPVKIF